MYELLFFAIGVLVSGIAWFRNNQKQSQTLHPKDRPFIADTHISIVQQGNRIVMVGTEELYAHKRSLTSIKTMCHRLKEKDIEIIILPESFIKQTWIIPYSAFLPKQSD